MIVSIMKHIVAIGLGIVLLNLLVCADAGKAPAKKNTNLMSWLRSMASMRSKRQDDRVYSLMDAIPGQPETDYPIFSEVPETAFSCEGRPGGYYADIEARCQVFRICANTAEDPAKGFGFLCPNGTLFNQQYFVCDWYMNVDCQNSENFYGLNEQIGNSMGTFSNNELMNSAKEIMGFPNSRQPGAGGVNNQGGNNQGGSSGKNPSRLPVKPSPSSGGGSNGNDPSRFSSNLGQPTDAASPFPSSGSGAGTAGPGGSNGGTVYVNSLGQLSTDDAGFDPKESYLLKPDSESNFDLDVRRPSLDTIKGIGNSYSFGFPQDSNAPIRGSADLSEPVDPSELYNNEEPYLPPFEDGQRKQIYTYPHDIQSQLSNGASPILPELTGQINTKLAAQSPKYPASQVYGPVASQPSSVAFQQPQSGHSQQGGNAQKQPHAGHFNHQSSAPKPTSAAFQQPQSGHSQQGGNVQMQPHAGHSNHQSSAPQPSSAAFQQPQSGHSQQGGNAQKQPHAGHFNHQSSAPQPTSAAFQQPQSGHSQQGGNAQKQPHAGHFNHQSSAPQPTSAAFQQPQSGHSQQGGNAQNMPNAGHSNHQYLAPQRPSQHGQSQPAFKSQQRQSPQKIYQQPNSASSFQSNGQSVGQTSPNRQYLQPSAPQSASQSSQRPGQSSSGQPISNNQQSGQTKTPVQQYGQNQPHQFERPGQSSSNQHSGQSQPSTQYLPPQSFQSQAQRSQQGFSQPQGFQQQAQPQQFRPQNQHAERRQFNVPQHNHYVENHQQNQGSNESFLRKLLENKVHIHHDKNQLVDLIQRIFVPEADQRVVSAEVFPSEARETYSFTYNEDTAASNNYNSIRHSNHQHSANCGHSGY